MHDKTNSGDLSRSTRQILFRGEPTYAGIGNKTWVYGNLVTDKYGNDWIVNQSIVDVGSKDGLWRLSEIVRGEVMSIANLAAKGWRNYFPFEETISLPSEFRMASQPAQENETEAGE